jgi:signal transduction histidine kinase
MLSPFDEMKQWIRFGAEDEARLRALWPAVESELVPVTDLFYARILESPGAAAVLRDEAQVERLKGTLKRWATELVSGPWDETYYQRRERIGRVHHEVGLNSRYIFTAMNVFRESLGAIATRTLPPAEAALAQLSLSRVCDMDLAIMTGTYVTSREVAQMRSLQDILVSHLPVSVLLVDSRGNVTAATQPGNRLFGEVPVIGRPWQNAFPPSLLASADLETRMAHVLATKRELVVPRVDVALDGEARNFQITIVPLDHPHARVLVQLEELTDAILAESRMRKTESLAQLGALSAAVAHELRNPLAGISGALQVLSRSMAEDDRRKPIMLKVEQQVRRLDELVTELLDFARPTEARVALLRIEDAARQIVELTQRDHPGVTVTLRGEGEALADPNLLQQVLLNLVLNAVQAVGDEGSVVLDVEGGRVTVHDSGGGIPMENREKVFEPFFTTRTRGTGLGLAICRKAAQAMGGRLTVGAGPMGGAAFLLELQLPS